MSKAVIAATCVLASAVGTVAADEGDRWDETTIGVQAGAGVGGGLIGGVVGASIGYAITSSIRGLGPMYGIVYGGAFGVISGAIIGVQVGGDSREGTGRWYGTTAGGVLGAAAGTGLLFGLAKRDVMPFPLLVAASITLGMSGPIIGYHLTGEDQPTNVPLLGGAF